MRKLVSLFVICLFGMSLVAGVSAHSSNHICLDNKFVFKVGGIDNKIYYITGPYYDVDQPHKFPIITAYNIAIYDCNGFYVCQGDVIESRVVKFY